MTRDEKLKHNMLLQIEQSKAYISYWHAEITSGAYKLRKIYRGGFGDIKPENELSDDEKLKDAMATLDRHCIRLRELVENCMMSVNDTL